MKYTYYYIDTRSIIYRSDGKPVCFMRDCVPGKWIVSYYNPHNLLNERIFHRISDIEVLELIFNNN